MENSTPKSCTIFIAFTLDNSKAVHIESIIRDFFFLIKNIPGLFSKPHIHHLIPTSRTFNIFSFFS